jgi:hypothetical protein
MRNEVRNRAGQILFTAEVQDSKLNINDALGKKICCLEHTGNELQLLDPQDNVLMKIESKIKTPVM